MRIIVSFAVLLSALVAPVRAVETPNIVILLADDLGFGDLACYGGPDAKTPEIDRMADEGARFTNGYASAPVCSPTRVALLTGQYQQRQGNAFEAYLGGGSPGLDGTTQKTLGTLLKTAGYRNSLLGKWNVSGEGSKEAEAKFEFSPNAHGFDQWIGIYHNHDQHTHVREKSEIYDLWQNGKRLDREGYTDDFLTDDAVKLIEQPNDAPFFIYLPFLSPHNPLQTHDSPKRYPAGDRSAFVKMVERLDYNVGRILAAVRNRPGPRDTIVMFTSDNGGQAAARNLPLSGRKLQLLEGGIRVPFIVWQPKAPKPGLTVDYPVITMDLTATALAAAGVSVPDGQPLDGIDLRPLLVGDQPGGSRTLYWRLRAVDHRRKTNVVEAHAVREGDWKLYLKGNKPQLFNLKDDIAEAHDLSGEQKERVAAMRGALEAWEKQVSPPEELYAK